MLQLIFLLTSLMFINTEALYAIDPDFKAVYEKIPYEYNTFTSFLLKGDKNIPENIRKVALKEMRNVMSGAREQLSTTFISIPSEYYANEIHSAILGFGADESALIDILCLLNNQSLLYDIEKTYLRFYRQKIETDILQNTAGNFQTLLLKCAANLRNKEFNIFYERRIERDTRRIIDSIRSTYRNDNELITMLGEYDFKRIKDIVNRCNEVTGEKEFLKNLIMKYPADDFQTAALKILTFAESPENYYALRIHLELVDSDFDHRGLIRLAAMDKDVDIRSVVDIYQRTFGKSLASEIADHIKEEKYQQFLFAALVTPQPITNSDSGFIV